MSKRSDKMYANSPKIETDADGKKVVTKGDKKAERTDDGTEGMPIHEKAALEMSQKHEKERLDLHHKHEKEHHALTSKHMKEGSPAEEKAESPAKEKSEKSKGEE